MKADEVLIDYLRQRGVEMDDAPKTPPVLDDIANMVTLSYKDMTAVSSGVMELTQLIMVMMQQIAMLEMEVQQLKGAK
jgi:hypothetical protein